MKTYIPFFYSENIKRPNKKFILHTVLGEDLIILLLAFIYSSTYFWQNAISLFLLQISFWCIYELGYIENDLVGEKFEDKAVLSDNYSSRKYTFSWWQPWLWSFILSALGIITIKSIDINNDYLTFLPFVSNNQFLLAEKYLLWIAFLVALRAIFYIYNHLNKQSRIWLYSLLQAFRYCGYLVLFTTNIIGLMLLISKILTRTMQYILYRYMGGKSSNWPADFPRYFFCLTIFLLLVCIIAANERNVFLILNYQVMAIALFCIARGCKQFYKVFSQFVPVSKDGSNRIT